MQRNEHFTEEILVFLFQRSSETACDASEDLEKLSQTVVRLGMLRNLKEQVHDQFFDCWSQLHEFAVNAMQNCFQVVSFSGVL
jgi:hypothetical protein